MKKINLLLLSFLLVSCGPSKRPNDIRYEITSPEQAEKIAKFVSDLCEKSNPHSDEEPEDMIKQAQQTALEIYGTKVIYIWNEEKSKYEKQ